MEKSLWTHRNQEKALNSYWAREKENLMSVDGDLEAIRHLSYRTIIKISDFFSINSFSLKFLHLFKLKSCFCRPRFLTIIVSLVANSIVICHLFSLFMIYT